MIGKMLILIFVVRLMKDGVIVDFDLMSGFLCEIMCWILVSGVRKFNVVVCILIGVMLVECCVILDVVRLIGVCLVVLIEEFVVVVIGVDLFVVEFVVNVIVDIGGGISEIVIILYGGVVLSILICIGGDYMDEEII